MYIVSRDKETIINMEQIASIYIESKTRYCILIPSSNGCLTKRNKR